ncbi:MAG: DUF87 domain-containing protein [Dehalococcoidia bacterium]|nr:DUF87 domain-containing protein [Dehalococcoidia bacterium]
MTSMIQALGDRAVGTVEGVSANQITVLLEPDAPQATALNTAVPAGFPRINGYLLVPNEAGATVGVITKVEVERLPYPKRRGMQDFGLVDLPFPGRKVSLTPLGTLVLKPAGAGGELSVAVRRGVDVFPSVGDIVILPTVAQLRAIVEGEGGHQAQRVQLGTCPTAAGAPVYVDPDKLFGRHLAVLGNTGAGKSCSVAGLIRWSLDAARIARTNGGRSEAPNARFIILDPNGEYAKAFDGLNARLFQVEPKPGVNTLKVPAWIWNGEEWAAFTAAAPGVQRPILFDAIRRLRSGGVMPDALQSRARARVKRYRTALKLRIQEGDHLQQGRREGVAQLLLNAAEDFAEVASAAEGSNHGLRDLLSAVAETCTQVEEAARGRRRDGGGFWHDDFSEASLGTVETALTAAGASVGLVNDEPSAGEDVPLPFPVDELPAYVEALAADVSGRDVAQFVDSMNLRIRGLFATGPLASVLDPDGSPTTTLEQWLTDYVGGDDGGNGPLTVIDLSLIPSEVIHLIVAVLARVIFEAVQRYRRIHGSVLPTVLVLEEAHTFVHRDLATEGAPQSGRACCRTFERIAREGRKFGLGLVLASQRPSEMSATVLSQCNTFLLHRIVNDRDQDLVRRLVPDALGDLLRDLPSLPSRRAVLLGWGAPAPVLVEVRELPAAHRPQSPDPEFWKVWTGEDERKVGWESIVREWQGADSSRTPLTDEQDPGAPDPP